MESAPNSVDVASLVRRGLLVCLAVKVATWALGWALAFALPFDGAAYFGNYGHYAIDARAGGLPPRFLDLWRYSDAEWYLSLAAGGYPDLVAAPNCGREIERPQWATEKHCKHKYAFFPLYAWTIAAVARVLPLDLAAFVVTALLGLGAAAGLAMLFARCFPTAAARAPAAVALLFLYPFGVFFQLYFTESLFLLLSVLAFLAAHERRWTAMLLAAALLALTRPLGVLVALPLSVAALDSRVPAVERRRAVASAALVPLGLVPFLALNYARTGDWTYFSTASSLWGYENAAVLTNLWKNVVAKGLAFPRLAFHSFHDSQVDYVVMVAFALAILAMAWSRRIPRALVLWSALLWLAPIASKDLMSFGRYMSVSFPVFLWLALVLPRAACAAVLTAFAAGYGIALAGVVTWAWVG